LPEQENKPKRKETAMKERRLIQLILIGAALCLGAACSDQSKAEDAAEEATESIEEAGDAIRESVD
jgi:hypothetical protein